MPDRPQSESEKKSARVIRLGVAAQEKELTPLTEASLSAFVSSLSGKTPSPDKTPDSSDSAGTAARVASLEILSSKRSPLSIKDRDLATDGDDDGEDAGPLPETVPFPKVPRDG